MARANRVRDVSQLKGSFRMSVSKIATTAVLALSLVVVPTMATAAPVAAKAAVTAPTNSMAARSGVRITRSNKGGGSSIIIAVLAAAAVVAGIVIAADGNSKSN
jgi:hypothetical protein